VSWEKKMSPLSACKIVFLTKFHKIFSSHRPIHT